MDSTAMEVIIQNTSATMALNGTLWVFMGFLGFMMAIAIIWKSTFSGC